VIAFPKLYSAAGVVVGHRVLFNGELVGVVVYRPNGDVTFLLLGVGEGEILGRTVSQEVRAEFTRRQQLPGGPE